MIKQFVALLLLSLAFGTTLTACDDAPDMDDAEVEIDSD